MVWCSTLVRQKEKTPVTRDRMCRTNAREDLNCRDQSQVAMAWIVIVIIILKAFTFDTV